MSWRNDTISLGGVLGFDGAICIQGLSFDRMQQVGIRPSLRAVTRNSLSSPHPSAQDWCRQRRQTDFIPGVPCLFLPSVCPRKSFVL
jgi:hypothetical protein